MQLYIHVLCFPQVFQIEYIIWITFIIKSNSFVRLFTPKNSFCRQNARISRLLSLIKEISSSWKKLNFPSNFKTSWTKMKLLQFTQEKFEMVGIDSTQNPFNMRILMVISVCCMCIISTSVFLFHDANNFIEYSNSIYLTTATMLIIVCYIVLITKMEYIFVQIQGFESVIDESMWMKLCCIVKKKFKMKIF